MLPLLVHVTNTETRASVDAGFSRSPVRLGRNRLNDLAIDESFVSQWHGLIRFDDAGTRFLDLGSTNGTLLGGERLAKNVEVDVGPDTVLEIGPLTLRFERMALGKDKILPRRAPAFQLGGTRRSATGVGAAGTVELGGGGGSLEDFAKTIAASIDGGAGVPPMDEIRAMAQRQRELLDRIRPLADAHEAALKALRAAVEEGLKGASSEAERDISAGLLRDTYPQAFDSGPSGGGAEGGADVAAWLDLLAPGSGSKIGSPEQGLQRAGTILEAFASAYLDLRLGQRQVQTELGIETGSEAESLPRFDDSRALLAYLFDPTVDVGFRLDELARAFADFAVHQLGLVNGATEGARSLLTVLSPQGVGAESATAVVRASMGLGDYLWPFRAAGNYYRYVEKHLDVATRDKFKTYLFGSAFGRAYYRVTGSRS